MAAAAAELSGTGSRVARVRGQGPAWEIMAAMLALALLFYSASGQSTLSDASIFSTCEHYALRQSAAEPQPGMHLLCVKSPGDGTLRVSLIKDGHSEVQFTHPHDTGDDFRLFAQAYELLNGGSNNRSVGRWKAFNTNGRRLWSVDRLAYEEMSIIFTNGLWIWPGVRPGYSWKVDETTKLTTLSLRPLVFRSENFLTDEECDYIIKEASPHLVPSKTSKMDKDKDLPDTTWRTSTQYFLPSKGRPLIEEIDYRVAFMTKTSVRNQELVQVLRYEKGQKYDHHTDYFDPRMYQNDPQVLNNIQNGEQNRLATVLWYLSTITDGGQTVFPRAFGETPANSSDCSTGLRVAPTRGEVVVFYSLTADGALDPFSVHGACPVGEGVKNAGNKWVWTQPLRDDEEEWEGEESGYDEEDEEEEEGEEGEEEGEEEDSWVGEGSIRPEL